MEHLSVEQLIALTVAITGAVIKLADYLIGVRQGKINWTIEERKANAEDRDKLWKWSAEQRAEMQTEINNLTAEIATQKSAHADEIAEMKKENAVLRKTLGETLRILRSCSKVEIGGTCEKMIAELEAL